MWRIFFIFGTQSRGITWVKMDTFIMSRSYPRFLFSNPQNTKSKGPFIISTIEPLIICRVHKSNSRDIQSAGSILSTTGSITIEFLALLYKPVRNKISYGDDIKDTIASMSNWMHFQLQDGSIPDWE